MQFPHGLVSAAPPAWQADADRADWLAQTVAPIGTFLSLLLTLGILGGGAAFLFGLWANHGRDPAVGSVPPRLREPPSDLPAPLAGTLVDEVASQKEVVAAVVDMADRGLVQLTDVQTPQLVGSGSDVRIRLQVGLDDARVRGYERALLAALFGSSPTVPAEVLLSSVKAQFQSSIPSIDARLYDAVTQQGLFARNPETIRRLWLGIGTAVIMVGIVLAVGAGVALGGAVPIAFLPGAALVVLGVALVVLAGSMPRRTRQGALEAAKWRAFRAFLADASRAERSGTALPPHYLPYAVAFGVDEAFVRHLESVGTPPPAWFGRSYGGPGGVVFLPGGWYGGPWMGPRPHDGGAAQPHDGQPGAGGIAAPAAPDPQGWSDALAGLLNAASEAMAHGGGSGGWSSGGFGGGGGGGGGSGGFR